MSMYQKTGQQSDKMESQKEFSSTSPETTSQPGERLGHFRVGSTVLRWEKEVFGGGGGRADKRVS